MKNLLIPVLLGLLTACTSPFSPSLKPHPQSQTELSQQRLFFTTVDQYIADGRTDILQQLQPSVPVSACENYAVRLLQLAEKKVVLEAELRQEKNRREKQQSELAELTEQNAQLTKQIEQLKKLLIEFERKAQ